MFKGREYVYEVYKERSFSKAARNLYISQPSLSAAVKKVEAELGCELFDRSRNPVQVTECGEAYIESIKQIMEIEASFNNFRADLEELKTGSISIGGTTFFTSFILPPIIQRFAEEYPQISIQLVETNTGKLEKELFEGGVDLVIDNYCFDKTLYDSQFFAKEQLILAVPRKYLLEEKDCVDEEKCANEEKEPLISEGKRKNEKKNDEYTGLTAEDIKNGRHMDADVKQISLEYFAGKPFLFLKEGNDTRIRADKICARSHFTPKITLMLDQQLTAYNLTCQGMGISFISDTLVKSEKPDSGVVYYKLENQNSSRNVSFYYKKTRYMKRAVKEFLRIADTKRQGM